MPSTPATRVPLADWKARYLDSVHAIDDPALSRQERDALRDMLMSSAARKALAQVILVGISRKEELLGLNPLLPDDSAKILRTQGAFAERHALIDEILSLIGVSS